MSFQEVSTGLVNIRSSYATVFKRWQSTSIGEPEILQSISGLSMISKLTPDLTFPRTLMPRHFDMGVIAQGLSNVAKLFFVARSECSVSGNVSIEYLSHLLEYAMPRISAIGRALASSECFTKVWTTIPRLSSPKGIQFRQCDRSVT